MFALELQKYLMYIAMEEAEAAIQRGDDPYGGVITDRDGNIIVRNGNRENTLGDPTAHAEVVLIRECCSKLKTNNLDDYVMICNYRSCPMCTAAMIQTGIRTFYIGSAMPAFFSLAEQISEIMGIASPGFTLVDHICDKECTEQVYRGRKLHAAEREQLRDKEKLGEKA